MKTKLTLILGVIVLGIIMFCMSSCVPKKEVKIPENQAEYRPNPVLIYVSPSGEKVFNLRYPHDEVYVVVDNFGNVKHIAVD